MGDNTDSVQFTVQNKIKRGLQQLGNKRGTSINRIALQSNAWGVSPPIGFEITELSYTGPINIITNPTDIRSDFFVEVMVKNRYV